MLRRLRLKNFKSFRAAEMPLGPLTLVVGTNASGKSNLRDALRFLHGIGMGYGFGEIVGEKYGPGGVLQWRGIRGGAIETPFSGETVFELEVEADLVDGGERFAVKHSIRLDFGSLDEPRVVDERLVCLSAGDEIPQPYVFDSSPHDDPIVQQGTHQLRVRTARTGRKRGPGHPFSSGRSVLAQLPSQPKARMIERRLAQALLDLLQEIRFLDPDPEAMRRPSPPGQTILDDRGENLSSVLRHLCSDPTRKSVLLDWLGALTPLDACDIVFRNDLTGRVLAYLVEADGREISAYSASDGTLRFIAMAAALLSPDSGRVYVFEELDNGIHPTRLHLLLNLVDQACRAGGIQVIGTTHNPALLTFLDESTRRDALLVYRPERAPDSRVRPIMSLPDIREALESSDLGHLHTAGWLEDIAAFDDDAAVDR